MNYYQFSERLKSARQKAGMNQAQLADAIGVKQNTISNYEKATGEKGCGVPKLDTVAKIADVLNVSLDWLTGRTDCEQVATNETKEFKYDSKAFLRYMITLIRHPALVCNIYGNMEDAVEVFQTPATRNDLVLRVNAEDAGDLYKRITGISTVIQSLEQGGIESAVVNDIVSSLEEKIINEFHQDFEIDFGTEPDDEAEPTDAPASCNPNDFAVIDDSDDLPF